MHFLSWEFTTFPYIRKIYQSHLEILVVKDFCTLIFLIGIHSMQGWTATTRPLLHPDMLWYRLNGMGAQKNAPKKVLVTLFPYIFLVKPKWNIVYEYLKIKIFSRDSNIRPQMHWTSNIFGHSATIIGSFWVSLNYPILNFKKTVCPKKVWMRHWFK